MCLEILIITWVTKNIRFRRMSHKNVWFAERTSTVVDAPILGRYSCNRTRPNQLDQLPTFEPSRLPSLKAAAMAWGISASASTTRARFLATSDFISCS